MRNSLRTRLTLIFVGLAILPLAIVGFVIIRRTFAVEREQAIVVQEQVAQRVATEVAAFIRAREDELRLLVDVEGLAQLDVERQRSLLNGLANNQNVYAEIVLLDSQGRETVFVSPTVVNAATELENRAGNPEFEIPQTSREPFYSSVRVDPNSGEPLMTIALPLIDLRTGEFTGVLAADFRFRPIWTLMAATEVVGSGSVYMVDNSNRVVAHPNSSIVLQGTVTELAPVDSFTSGLDGSEVVQAHTNIEFGQSATLEPQQFTIVAEQPAQEALALARQSIFTSGTAILISAILASVLGGLAALNITRPIGEMAETAQAISGGDLSQTLTVTRQDEIGTLGRAFNSMTAQLQDLIGGLEQRISARTRDLNLATKIGREVSRVRDLDDLLSESVRLIQGQFDLYQTQIYLVDETRSNLILRASTGHAGSSLLDAGHKLPIGQGSLNGLAAVEKRAIIVADTATNPMFLSHPALPDTRAEMVVPLLVETEVVGVLDLQSDQPGVLEEESLPAFEVLAGQLAVAIQNARLFDAREEATAELRESEERFTLAVAGSNEGIWDWDIPGDEVYFSPRWKAMLGYEEHEISNDFTELESRIHPEDHDRMMQAVADYLEGKTDTYEHEFRMRHKDGSYRWILVRAILTRDEDGNPLRMAGSHSDITARKQSEEELRKEQERTETILQSIAIPMLISRASDGKMHYVNEHLAEVVGVPMEQLMTQGTPDFYVDPEDREVVVGQVQERGFVNNYELRLRHANGDIFWALLSARLINFAGEPAIITSLIDITDRKQAQAIQEKQAADLQTVVDVSTTVAALLEQEKLLQDVVDLTKERFNLYHAHIYLIDDAGENLVLTAGAGEVGQQMVAEKYTIPVAQEQSLVARAARNRQGVIINDVQADPKFLPNLLLPDTRAEMAVPMIARDQLLGVLDVQADEVDYFTEQDTQIQTTLAAQTAVALQNARQYQATGKALDEANTFRQLVAASGQGIGIADLDGNAIYANPAMMELLGAGDTTPASNPSIFSFYPPDIQLRFSEEIIPTVMEQGQWQGELRLATSDGEILTYENYFLLRDEAGNPAQFASIITDISAQKEHEIVLAQNQAQLQQAMRAARLADWQYDMATQNFTFNEQAYDLLGTSVEVEGGYTQSVTQFTGKFVHRADRTLVTETVNHLLTNPETPSTEKEVRIRYADGMLRTMLFRFEVGEVGDGQVLSLIGTMQDITARKEAELQQEKLARQLEERLEQLNAMQRAMTREGWEAFLTAHERSVQGFMFAEDALQPVGTGELKQQITDASLDFDTVNTVTYNPQKSAIAMPIDLHGETIGVIGAHNESGESLSEEQQMLLEALSAQVAEALERARLFEETELNRQRLDQRASELQAVAEISATASTALETRQLLETFARLIKDRLDLYHCNIFTFDETGDHLHITASSWRAEEDPESSFDDFAIPLHQEQSLVAKAARTRQAVLVNDITADPAFLPSVMMPHTQSELSLPLIAGGQVVGVLDVQAREKNRFSEDDVRIHETLASQIAVSWQNAQLYTVTQRRAEREAMINTISQKIQGAATVQAALQTAVSELGRALNARQVQVKVRPSSRGVQGNGRHNEENGRK